MPPAPAASSAKRSTRQERSGRALPEQTFFDDPVLDRLMGMTVALAAEVYTLRSRVLDLERTVAASAPDAFTQDQADDARHAREDADRFVARLFEPQIGEQQSKGPIR